jgi:acyl-CoA synthetase (AMP-forming)/AMP-acid ligase II
MTTQQTIGELLRQQGEQLGSRPFLQAPGAGAPLSFAAVQETVESWAAGLRDQGVRDGDRVALLLPNGLAAALSILAVLAAGAVVVPLNPRLTDEEVAQLLQLSQARFVLGASDAAGQGALPGDGWRASADHGPHWQSRGVRLFSRSAGEDAPRAPQEVSAQQPALILYTSGTTGTPKGVLLSHANLLQNAAYVRQAHALESGDAALCILPLFHINGLVVTLLTPLLAGIPVLLPPRFESASFWGWVSDYRITWFSAVPTILSLLLSQPDPDPQQLATLRFARSASAPLPVAVLEEFERRFGIPVIETYGISEAACQVSANPLPPAQRKPGSAGRPVGNRLVVVDRRGHSVAPGQVGEVTIRGENVFRGYLDNPAADREALRDGWFYTGDLGYLDPDGFLFLTGRKKEMINRAGEKIAPREVEEVVHRLPEVETVGVVGVPHQLYGEEVAAFITVRQGSRLSGQQVRDFCRAHLAGFKVPREVFFIPEFPRGPSGKVQRRRLLEVYAHLKEQQVPHETHL